MEDVLSANRRDRRPYVKASAVDVTLPDGTRYQMPPTHERLSNANVRSIPTGDCALKVKCQAGSLFAVVTHRGDQDYLIAAGFELPRLQFEEPMPAITLPCVCGGRHDVDVDRTFALADARRDLLYKDRAISVSLIAPTA